MLYTVKIKLVNMLGRSLRILVKYHDHYYWSLTSQVVLFIIGTHSVLDILPYVTGTAGPQGMTGLKGDPGESISSPEVTVSPATQTVTENQTATFYCSASGNPRPVVTWRKISGTLGGEALSTNDGKLEIQNSSYNDTGKYICKAISALGQDQEMTSLVVEGG